LQTDEVKGRKMLILNKYEFIPKAPKRKRNALLHVHYSLVSIVSLRSIILVQAAAFKTTCYTNEKEKIPPSNHSL